MSKFKDRLQSAWPIAIPLLMAVYLAYVSFLPGRGQRRAFFCLYLFPWGVASAGLLLAGAALVAGLLWYFRRRRGGLLTLSCLGLLLGTQVAATWVGWPVVRMGPYGFDHPSFMFRIWEFARLFPGALGSYLPLWNAGVEHFVGVTSGAHGWGLLCWPLLRVWPPHVFYGAALLFWFLWAWPWIAVASLRTAGARWPAALAGGAMMCGISRSFFMWMWHFGTAGAMTSAMAVLPVMALGYRVAIRREGTFLSALALAVCAILLCLWTPGAFLCAGLAAGALWAWVMDFRASPWRAADWLSLRWLLFAVVLVLLGMSRWWWTVLVPCHNVVEYVGTDVARPPLLAVLREGTFNFVAALTEGHPLAIVLGLAGLFVVTPPRLRCWVAPAVLVMALLAGWSKPLKPLSQMDRMAIPMTVALVLPATAFIDSLLAVVCAPSDAAPATAPRPRAYPILACFACGLILVTLVFAGRTICSFYSNHNPDGIWLRTWENNGVQPIADWITENVPPTGRIAFAGKAVHAYGGGNTAYLPVLTGREMMGDDYYGFPRGTIEYNYPPAAYRDRKSPGWLEWSRLYGITHWIAAADQTVRALQGAPEILRSVAVFPIPVPFKHSRHYDAEIFEVIPAREAGFEQWSARVIDHPEAVVAADLSHLSVEFPPDVPLPSSAILRYNWREGLYVDGPGAIEPAPMDENVTFIRFAPDPDTRRIDIRYHVRPTSIPPNFDGRFHH